MSAIPHDVRFDSAAAGATAAPLHANMSSTIAPLTGPYLSDFGALVVVSFAGIAPGTYPFRCMPHEAMGTRGRIVVSP